MFDDQSALVTFLYVLLHVGTSACLLAEESETLRLLRHLDNAQRCYGNVMRFMPRAGLQPKQLADVRSKAEQLRLRLESLGARLTVRIAERIEVPFASPLQPDKFGSQGKTGSFSAALAMEHATAHNAPSLSLRGARPGRSCAFRPPGGQNGPVRPARIETKLK